MEQDRAELAGICDQFGIQISNPCIIMMQETSRDFLGSSRPEKKYDLFEKACFGAHLQLCHIFLDF